VKDFLYNATQDVRYALRQLRKSKGFAVTAIVTLALGIGANTAIFTLVQGILLRSLPVSDPKQLYRIGDTNSCCVSGGFVNDNGDFDIFSYDLYLHMKKSAPEFEQLAAVMAGEWSWSIRRGNEVSKSLGGEFVSGNYFSTLGLRAYSGRVFSDTDDQPSAAPAAVVSYHTWQTEFAADPSIIGSTIFVQTRPFTIVGIASPGFFGDRVSQRPPDFWFPLQSEPYVRGDSSILHHPESNWLYAIGRVRTGTNLSVLQGKLSAALRQWLATNPTYTDNGASTLIPKQHVVLVPGGGGIQALQQETGTGLKMLMMLSTVVLLISCANIANLLLARGTARRADIAVRMAIGASRRRLLRQIITESVILAFAGGLAGLVVAYAGSNTILAIAFPDARNSTIDANPSLTVLGFAFLVSLVTGVLFGIAPAWLSWNAQPADVLRGSNRSTRDRSSLPQQALVVLQAALSIVLLTGAVLMSRSLGSLEHQNFGFKTASRYVFHFDPDGAGYTINRLPGLYRTIEERFSAVPGVSNVGMGMYSPLEGNNWSECVIQQGHSAPGPNARCDSTWVRVSAGFLDSIGVPVVRGRGFTDRDTATSPQVALVNEAFARQFFAGHDAVGQHFGIDMPKYSGSWEIVGVFRDFKMNNPRDPVRPVFLRPVTQQFAGFKEPSLISTENQSMFMNSIVVNFAQAPQDAEELIRKTLASVDPNLTVVDLRTFGRQVEGNFNQERLIARLTSLFGALALVLACIGQYGVLSYFVVRRTSEIGIRMALGAARSSVISMVLRTALVQIFLGLALGVPAAFFAGRLMASQLYGVGANDPIALCAAAAVLALCAGIAGFVPARRAASIEPMQALRTE
jgi:macrolide transport system ATP-binding/permease protein